MTNSRPLLRLLLIPALLVGALAEPAKIHHTIGLPDTPDALKVFVEPGGRFSPGFGTFGVTCHATGVGPIPFNNPSMVRRADVPGPEPIRVLAGSDLLVAWIEDKRGEIHMRVEVCEVKRETPRGAGFIVAARVRLTNPKEYDVYSTTLTVSITPEGPAGGPIHALAFSQHAFSIEGHPVLIAQSPSQGATLASWSFEPRPLMPQAEVAVTSMTGDCRGSMLFDVALPAKGSVTLGFLCPVLPGRRAGAGGALQPDPGLEFYRGLNVDELFAEAEAAVAK